MKDFGLFAERDAARAERKLGELTRFAARREIMLETIDLDALDRNTAFDILETDEDRRRAEQAAKRAEASRNLVKGK